MIYFEYPWDIHRVKPNLKPNPIGFGALNVGEKLSPNFNPRQPKPTNIPPETTRCHR